VYTAGIPYFADTLTGWHYLQYDFDMGGKSYGILYSTVDGGATWDIASGPGLVRGLHNTIFCDSMRGFRVLWPGAMDVPSIGWTMDGGKTWQGKQMRPPSADPGFFDRQMPHYRPRLVAVPPETLIVAFDPFKQSSEGPDSSYLYISPDCGMSRETCRYPGGRPVFLSRQIGWAAAGTDLFKTENGGRDWVLLATLDWEGVFDFVSELDGWALAAPEGDSGGRSGRMLMRTTDGGRTWSKLSVVIGAR
jgi:hypothetical protein